MRSLADKCLQDVHDTNEMHGMMLAPTLCPRKTSHYQRCMSRVVNLYFFHLYILKEFVDWHECILKLLPFCIYFKAIISL